MAISQPLRLVCSDDRHVLAGTRYSPSFVAARACVLIAPSIGVSQRFYEGFARWLSDCGTEVVTFDYRGTFESAELNANSAFSLLDWGRDLATAVQWLCEEHPHLRRFAVCHGIGAHLLGFAKNAHELDRMVWVGSGSLYWAHGSSLLSRLSSLAMSFLVLPLMARLMGRFPGRTLGILDDLPGPVASHWARWCRHPRYAAGAEEGTARYDRIKAEVLSLYFEADALAPEAGVHDFGTFCPNAAITYRRVTRQAFPEEASPHFDLFRQSHGAKQWPLVVGWLLSVPQYEEAFAA